MDGLWNFVWIFVLISAFMPIVYPQPRQARPSVQFVPVPYRRDPESAPTHRIRSTP
jgi:hypothetical protein